MSSSNSSNALIIFAKYPEQGKVKTRLAATIGSEGATLIYEKFIDFIMVQSAASALDFTSIAAITPRKKLEEFRDNFRSFADYWIQADSPNLGERLSEISTYAFQNSFKKIVIIGTDSPTLPSEIIKDAFIALEDVDVVIGPSEDGGYYLIGIKQPHLEIFQNIRWSTEYTFDDTMNAIKNLKLRFKILPEFYDIDTIDDFTRMIRENPDFPVPNSIKKKLPLD